MLEMDLNIYIKFTLIESSQRVRRQTTIMGVL